MRTLVSILAGVVTGLAAMYALYFLVVLVSAGQSH